MKRAAIAILCLMFCFTTAPAFANSAVGVVVAQQSTAPIVINTCYGGLEDTSVGNIDYYVYENVAFYNFAAAAATAVEFRFDFLDAFGDVLGTRYGQKTGTFAPGVLIEPRRAGLLNIVQDGWSSINIWPGMKYIRCSVSRALFADGRSWNTSTSDAESAALRNPIH